MRPTTSIWAQFESTGFPQKTKRTNGELQVVVGELAEWLLDATMNYRVTVTFAPTEELLAKSKRVDRVDTVNHMSSLLGNIWNKDSE